MMFETEMSSTSPYAKFAGVSSVTSTSLDGTPYERTTTPAALRGATTVEHIDSRTAGTTPCGAAHGGRGAAALAEAGDGKRPAATSAAKASARDIASGSPSKCRGAFFALATGVSGEDGRCGLGLQVHETLRSASSGCSGTTAEFKIPSCFRRGPRRLLVFRALDETQLITFSLQHRHDLSAR